MTARKESSSRPAKGPAAEHHVIFNRRVSLAFLLVLNLLITNSTRAEHDDISENGKILEDNSRELPDEALEDILSSFGKSIKNELVQSDVIRELDEQAKTADKAVELVRFKGANLALAKDAEIRIKMAGEINRGQLTQSALSSFASSFVGQVSGRLGAASSYIGAQLSALDGLAAKLRSFSASLANKLRRLLRWPTFLEFKIKFNRSYPSMRSELYRQMIYLRTQTQVGTHNFRVLLRSSSHIIKATNFADWTDDEFHETYHNALEAEDDHAGVAELSEQARKRMLALALQSGHSFSQHKSGERRRRKRSITMVDSGEMDDSDEEDESEDRYTQQAGAHGSDAQSDPGSQDAQVMDEFIGDVDMSEADDLEDMMDEVLNEKKTFTRIDLRDTGCLIEAEDQYKCGMCYAIVINVAASYFECQAWLADRADAEPIRYNPRFTADCGVYMAPRPELNRNIRRCKGGKVTSAFVFAQLAGVKPFYAYEHARISTVGAESVECPYPRPESVRSWAKPVHSIRNMQLVSLNLSDVDLHLRTVGPVLINIRTWKNFKFQGAGIYGEFQDAGKTTLHSMLLVGHDYDPNGREYWILMNSHGIAFGENGYVRIYTESLLYFKVYLGGFIPAQWQDDQAQV